MTDEEKEELMKKIQEKVDRFYNLPKKEQEEALKAHPSSAMLAAMKKAHEFGGRPIPVRQKVF